MLLALFNCWILSLGVSHHLEDYVTLVLLALCAATFVCAWRTRRDKNDALSKIDALEAHVKKLISERDELIKKVKAQGVGSPQDSGINEPSTIATAGSATSTPRPSAPMSIDYDVRRPLEFQDSAMRVAGTPVNPNVLSRRQRSGSSSNLGSPKNYLDFAEELRRGRKD